LPNQVSLVVLFIVVAALTRLTESRAQSNTARPADRLLQTTSTKAPLWGSPTGSKACNATTLPNVRINNTIYDGVYAFDDFYKGDTPLDYVASWIRVQPSTPLASNSSYELFYFGNVSASGANICTDDQLWIMANYTNNTLKYPFYYAADCAAHPTLITAKW
jgi:hypothetical protein